MNPQIEAIAREIYGVVDDEECPHARIDCYDENDPESEEFIGWHCLDCGAPVQPPTVDQLEDDLDF